MDISRTFLALRRPAPVDATAVLAIAHDPDVVLWNPMPTVLDLASAQDWCRRNADWSDGSHASWVVVDEDDGCIGTCSVFNISDEDASAAIGYRVAASARGRHVARRAVDAATRWSFSNLGLARLQLAHSLGNDASCRVAVGSGFAVEGTLRSAHVDGWGQRRDEHVHGRLASDPCDVQGSVRVAAE